MTDPKNSTSKLRAFFSPYVYLSSNPLSMLGVILVTSAVMFWLFILPTTLSGEAGHPYLGILIYMVLPVVFFTGLGLIPLGIALRTRRQRKRGTYPLVFPPLNLQDPKLRRLAIFVGVTTFANLIIASQLTYSAVTYMDSVTFCGQTCHTVMQPEFMAYQNSPHSRVECTKCHIGPGASWFVKSKLSGAHQVLAVTFNTFERPVPTPVRNLRPARDTCEACHWPEKFGGDRLQILPKFADDEANTLSKTVLLMRIRGGAITDGIHGAHVGRNINIRYASDESRQKIPWVEFREGDKATVYKEADFKQEDLQKLTLREMDCMDCHNRPSHTFELPERAVNHAMGVGKINASLPFMKKVSMEMLQKPYATREQAAAEIPNQVRDYYRKNYGDQFEGRKAEIEQSAKAILDIWERNVFPAMKVTWGSYPNNLGHTDFPGCFRCHDDGHVSSDNKTITQDCNSCHHILSMEEESPKILSDLGLQ